MRNRPASGGAAVLKPGTNFANSSEPAPKRVNTFSVWRTQESGSSAIRHNRLSTE